MFFILSRRQRASVLPLLSILTLPQIVWSQPPDVPSSIKKPANDAVMRVPVAPPDPPLITTAELQKLTGGPTLVTFSGQNVPAKEIAQTLREAAKMPISNVGIETRLKPVSVEWKDVPFWNAARDVEKQSGGTWSTQFGNGLSLTTSAMMPVMRDLFGFGAGNSAPGLSGRVAAQTPFVTLFANSLSRTSTHSTRLGETEGPLQGTPDRTQLSMTAYFDPKLTVRSVALRDLKFRERENPPIVNGPQLLGGLMLGSRGNSTVISPQTVQIPPDIAAGTTIARISGMLHSVVATASETWNVPDLLAAPKATQAIGAGQYTFESAEIKENQLIVHVSAQTGAAPQTDIASFTSARVRDAQGRAVPGGLTRLEGQKADLSFRLNEAIPGPYSLEWVITTETKSLDVPFELRDVVVP